MDFARRQLEKYGWEEGQGLGRNEDGITKAVKPNLKFDKAGLGHDVSEDFNNPWWERLYNEAADNIITKQKNDVVTLDTKGESIEITAKKRKRKSKKQDCDATNGVYKGFVKTSELRGNSEADCRVSDADSDEEVCAKKKSVAIRELTNEELFEACGGRTVHKGARHGLKMSAKLARIEEHEKNLMKTLHNCNTISKDCKRESSKSEDSGDALVERSSENFIKKKKKKKKREKE